MHISEAVKYVGVNDHKVDLFEGQYHVPNGMSYNSYVIFDKKIAVMDTVDIGFSHEWLENLEKQLDGRKPDYLVVQHMEPDHSASIPRFLEKYPDTRVIATAKAFDMMEQFFEMSDRDEGQGIGDKRIIAQNGGILELGAHKLQFHFAPMVHWPEVMMTYEQTEKILFSADAFGKFGALDIGDEWLGEARRYYMGIVAKYGMQVQNILKKAAGLSISIICPLHGPVLVKDVEYYINRYRIWSSYESESRGVMVAYASIYGYTKQAVLCLVEELRKMGVDEVIVHDLARDDMAQVVADAFQYDRMVLASSTYNGSVFPFMQIFIHHLLERNYQKRTVGLIENGSWAPTAAKIMKEMFQKSREINFTENTVTILSAMKDHNREEIKKLAEELAEK